MKIKSLLHLVVVLLAGQFLFSCSSAEYFKFSAQKPEAYNKIKEKPAPAEIAPTMAEVALAAANQEAKLAEAAPVMEANAAAVAPTFRKHKTAEVVKVPAAEEEISVEKREITVTEAEALAMARERIANMTKTEKKDLKKELREAYRQDRGRGGASIIEIVLAILLPPLAVFLHEGIGSRFWISVILTILGFLPGVIFALLVVTDTI